MQKTLLEIVQDILNDMDSDSVNSIDDTEEARQVAQIVRTTYEKWLAARDDWPFLRTLSQLTGLGDLDNPTKMQIPEDMTKVEWVKYNKKDVTYLPPKEFKDMLDTRTETTDIVDANGYILNADPTYWTSYDEEYIHFDGYDSAVDTTLQQSKSVVYGLITPDWEHEDQFTPVLPAKMFPAFIADAKGTAFLALKQQAQAKEEEYARKSFSRFQKSSFRNRQAEPKTNENVDYGR
jgi:hypothetical protein